jgi:hypothetical protein
VPVSRRAQRGWQPQSLAALWLAVLLAITPYARPALPGSVSGQASSARSSELHDSGPTRTEQSAPRLRADKPDLGVLPRSPYIEATAAPPPDKIPLIRPEVPQAPVAAANVAAAFAGDAVPAFHRGAVGTARIPTGPPA